MFSAFSHPITSCIALIAIAVTLVTIVAIISDAVVKVKISKVNLKYHQLEEKE